MTERPRIRHSEMSARYTAVLPLPVTPWSKCVVLRLASKSCLKAARVLSCSGLRLNGGCQGVQGIVDGKIAATSQQYPLKMASMGVEAIVKFAKEGVKPTGYTDTGVTLITDKAQAGVDSKDSTYGLANCWGNK